MTAPLKTLQLTNWRAAAELMAESWKENRERPLDYTPSFIQSLAAYPASLPVIAPAFFQGDRLAAFVMGFPRSFLLEGAPKALLLMTFFTVGPEFKGQGLGREIWATCLKQAKEAGYDGALYYCVEGNVSNKVTAAGVRLTGRDPIRIFSVRYLMKALRPSPDPAPATELVEPDFFLSCVSAMREVPLQRVWTHAEVEWQLQRPGAIALAEPAVGVITGYTIQVADVQRTTALFIEDVLWITEDRVARSKLLARLLAQASQVATLAIVPILGYIDLDSFSAAGFRKSPRVLNSYLVVDRDKPDNREMQAIYADIL